MFVNELGLHTMLEKVVWLRTCTIMRYAVIEGTEWTQFRNIALPNRLDLVAQWAEHWSRGSETYLTLFSLPPDRASFKNGGAIKEKGSKRG
jgi:hypothetical protein